MPKDPYRIKPPAKRKPRAKASRPSVTPSQQVKAPTGGVSPGARGGNAQGLIGQPSIRKTPHITKRSQLPKAKQGASLKRGRGR